MESIRSTPAQYGMFCSVCNSEIAAGEEMFPFVPVLPASRDGRKAGTGGGGGGAEKRLWSHARERCRARLFGGSSAALPLQQAPEVPHNVCTTDASNNNQPISYPTLVPLVCGDTASAADASNSNEPIPSPRLVPKECGATASAASLHQDPGVLHTVCTPAAPNSNEPAPGVCRPVAAHFNDAESTVTTSGVLFLEQIRHRERDGSIHYYYEPPSCGPTASPAPSPPPPPPAAAAAAAGGFAQAPNNPSAAAAADSTATNTGSNGGATAGCSTDSPCRRVNATADTAPTTGATTDSACGATADGSSNSPCRRVDATPDAAPTTGTTTDSACGATADSTGNSPCCRGDVSTGTATTAGAAAGACGTAGSAPPPQQQLQRPLTWRIPVCRHWRLRGRCAVADAGLCAFGHPAACRLGGGGGGGVDGAAKRGWGGRRRLLRNKDKSSVFRVWLGDTFGLAWLRGEAGCPRWDARPAVLDVAGGKGDLGWELRNCTGVRQVAVVDPRAACRLDSGFAACARKWRKGYWDPQRTGPVFARCNPGARGAGPAAARPAPVDPWHLRVFFAADAFHRRLAGDAAPPVEQALAEPSVEQLLGEQPLGEQPLVVQPLVKTSVEQLLVKQLLEEQQLVKTSVEQPLVKQPLEEQPLVKTSVEQLLVKQPLVNQPLEEQPLAEPPVEQLLAKRPLLNQPLEEQPLVEPSVKQPPAAAARNAAGARADGQGSRAGTLSETEAWFFGELARADCTTWTRKGLGAEGHGDPEEHEEGHPEAHEHADGPDQSANGKSVTQPSRADCTPSTGKGNTHGPDQSRADTRNAAGPRADGQDSRGGGTAEGTVRDLATARSLVRGAKLVVGMHPDEAASEIVEFAVARNIPFAVVPCCVHLKTFPKRKLRSGKRVTTFEDLVDYLMELHPKSRKCVLDFEGRNVCIYCLPEDLMPECAA
ncbi:hypothetical protein DIPPA_01919 [Diplonema papillatum]|nr:hypothetical protein DIPPA_01919 [Diplonema papillatum]